VLGRRERFLEQFHRKETSALFHKWSEQVEVDWEQIEAKVQQEAEAEQSRPGARPY
jgi:hypothetical protein